MAKEKWAVRTASVFGGIERAFYIAVAAALAVAGAILFGSVTIQFLTGLGKDLASAVLSFLDGILLVFIITELLHTIRTVIDDNVLRTQPFLVVGIVAAIRRLIVITAEAQEAVGKSDFPDLMIEMGILVLAVLILGGTIFLVRHTEATASASDPSTEA